MKVKVKKKPVAKKTVDLTVKDFQTSMGLGKEMKGYIAATVMLGMLVKKGIAKEVARLHIGSDRVGRKSVIYRIPVEFTLKAKGVDAA